MHSAQYNRGRVELVVSPRGPILIRSGKASMDPTHPDLEWVRTRHAVGVETVYLPGSSLKGVLRAQAERVLRSLGRHCCDPLDQKGRCQNARKKGEEAAAIYARVCAACRTFGSLGVGGRAQFTDAYPWDPTDPPEAARKKAALASQCRSRTGVAIDRKTGATKRGALYDLEVVEQGDFHAEIGLVNVQLWQLRLLLHVLRDLDEGFVRLGSGKSRGLGRVRCTVKRLTFEWLAKGEDLLGTGALAPDAARWGLAAPEQDRAPLGDLRRTPTGVYNRIEVQGVEIDALTAALDKSWRAFMDAPALAATGGRG